MSVIDSHILHLPANVRKWEKSVQDDEKDLEKLKKDETKTMKVRFHKPKKRVLHLV